MKFYNPFKPHIAKFNDGSFAVRKWYLGWEYRSNDATDNYWWAGFPGSRKYYRCKTIEQARNLLNTQLAPQVIDNPMHSVRVE